MGAEYYHALGIGICAFGTVGVVSIGLTAGPTGDGVLKIVEYLDVYVVGRTI